MTYLDRATLLALFTHLEEADFTHPHLGGQPLRIRELTAQAVHDVRQSARASGVFDGALFNVMVIQQGLIDKPGGQPFLTPLDVAALMQGRKELTERLSAAIWALSEATPEAFRQTGTLPDSGGNADAGAGGAADEPGAADDGA